MVTPVGIRVNYWRYSTSQPNRRYSTLHPNRRYIASKPTEDTVRLNLQKIQYISTYRRYRTSQEKYTSDN